MARTSGVGRIGTSGHMRDYMAGTISVSEYVRRTRRDVAAVVKSEMKTPRSGEGSQKKA